jgi:hypothetical protein
MKRLYFATLAAVFLTVFLNVGTVPIARAGKNSPSLGSGFRCGNLLMDEGLDKLQVLVNCGDPVATDKSWIDKYGEVERIIYGPINGYYYILFFFASKLIQIEEVQQL